MNDRSPFICLKCPCTHKTPSGNHFMTDIGNTVGLCWFSVLMITNMVRFMKKRL